MRDVIRRVVPRSLQLWLRHPKRSALWLRDQLAGRAGKAERLQMTAAWELSCHPGAREAFILERDEPAMRAELDGFLASCREGMVLFDIGAHFGLFTLATLRWGGSAARVVAADPSPEALTVFDANMTIAGAGARVDRFCAAIAEADGEAELLTGGAGTYHMMIKPDAPRAGTVRVPMITLETLSGRTGLRPTHVKIDVEGEEDAVIRGGERLLRESHPLLFLELHGGIQRRAGRSPLSVLERLQTYGYRHFEIARRPVEPAQAAEMDVARLICRC